MFEGATAKELGLNKVTAPDDKGVMRDWWAVSLAGMSDGQVASCRKLTSYYRACVLRDSFWLQPQQQLSKEQGERTFEWQKQIHLQQERVVSDRTTLKSYAECMAKVRLEEAQHAAEEAAAEEAAEEQDKEEEDPDGYGAKTVRPKKDIVEDPTLEAEEAAGARGARKPKPKAGRKAKAKAAAAADADDIEDLPGGYSSDEEMEDVAKAHSRVTGRQTHSSFRGLKVVLFLRGEGLGQVITGVAAPVLLS